MTSTDEIQIHRGLSGVYFDRSQTCFIDGRAGKLQYRGYSIDDLAGRSTFEETSYLLLHGGLPTAPQLEAFDAELKASRTLPGKTLELITLIKDAHPMDVLRTAVSGLAASDPEAADKSHDATLRKGLRLAAQVPSIVMAHHAIREGREPVEPNPKLSHAANFLYMLNGEEPSQDAADLMDTDFILHAEHGSNASSFTARVVTGTQADLHGAITAAIAALSGPSHGGAAENVMKMAQEIGEPERAADYVKELRSRSEPIMGFGHRVYRAEDPRARHLREGVRRLSAGEGRAEVVRDPGGGAGGDASLRAAWRQRQRRLLRGRDLLPARHPAGPLRADLRRRARTRLDGAGAGADGEQHPAAAAAALRRSPRPAVRADRGTLDAAD